MTSTSTSTGHPANPTRADVEALFTPMCEAWSAQDPVGTAAMYGVDGRLIDPFGREHDGRDRIEQAFEENFRTVLAGSTTTIEVQSVRELVPGLAVVDALQTFTGGLPDMHATLIVRGGRERAEVVECRPYPFLEPPPG
jgi:uncharacterized protein (TIGR02246 family)